MRQDDLPGIDMQMTASQLREWANIAAFTATDHINSKTVFEIQTGNCTDDGRAITKLVVFASVWRTIAATLPDGTSMQVTYEEEVEWNTNLLGRADDAYKTHPVASKDAWSLVGVTLADEEGSKEGDCVIEGVLNDIFGNGCDNDATAIDYAKLLPPPPV